MLIICSTIHTIDNLIEQNRTGISAKLISLTTNL